MWSFTWRGLPSLLCFSIRESHKSPHKRDVPLVRRWSFDLAQCEVNLCVYSHVTPKSSCPCTSTSSYYCEQHREYGKGLAPCSHTRPSSCFTCIKESSLTNVKRANHFQRQCQRKRKKCEITDSVFGLKLFMP